MRFSNNPQVNSWKRLLLETVHDTDQVSQASLEMLLLRFHKFVLTFLK